MRVTFPTMTHAKAHFYGQLCDGRSAHDVYVAVADYVLSMPQVAVMDILKKHLPKPLDVPVNAAVKKAKARKVK